MKLPGRKPWIFEVCTAPSYRKNNWKRWGASPPTFSSGFCGRGGPFRAEMMVSQEVVLEEMAEQMTNVQAPSPRTDFYDLAARAECPAVLCLRRRRLRW